MVFSVEIQSVFQILTPSYSNLITHCAQEFTFTPKDNLFRIKLIGLHHTVYFISYPTMCKKSRGVWASEESYKGFNQKDYRFSLKILTIFLKIHGTKTVKHNLVRYQSY